VFVCVGFGKGREFGEICMGKVGNLVVGLVK
jgi:hypothetical protein